MAINNRIFKAILILIAVLIIAGYGLVFYLQLDEPMFFYHNYDQRVFDNESNHQDISFNLNYITNARDNRVVIGIEFPKYPDIIIQATEFRARNPFNWNFKAPKVPGDIYGLYSVRSVTCNLMEWPRGRALDDVVLEKAKILFSDASEIVVDIGTIQLYTERFDTIPLEPVLSSSSSDGSGKTAYKILENLTIVAVDSASMEKFKDRVQWQINTKTPEDSVGMTFQEGSALEVTSRVDSTEDIVSEYTLFDLHPKVIFMDDNGVQYTQRFYNIDSIYHNYSFIELYRYIRARRTI
ncbi:hypothetical protein [Fusibacter ferrireducens]|uniref:Uncharacterized protein n=1 Tax=Fusibacter ferrireducens TaxID=2785058 RepID=A0ABR9ZNZ8_9FIRM|nr:hypothetical protein [Fusibacter ferrireducens]MBF4692139.1 hypothetical protein [Fusibacter ferrireducens]